MISVILEMAEAGKFKDLPEQSRAKGRAKGLRFTSDAMPGSRKRSKRKLVDILLAKDATETEILELMPGAEIIYLALLGTVEINSGQVDEQGSPIMVPQLGWIELIPLKSVKYRNLMADENDGHDEQGNPINPHRPTTEYETHRFSGHPERF